MLPLSRKEKTRACCGNHEFIGIPLKYQGEKWAAGAGHRRRQSKGKANAKQMQSKASKDHYPGGHVWPPFLSHKGSAPDPRKAPARLMCAVASELKAVRARTSSLRTALLKPTVVNGRSAICARGRGAIRLWDCQGDKMPVRWKKRGKGGNGLGSLFGPPLLSTGLVCNP